ncbi:MAG TPA: ligase-associated DNA damage response DEXH box helicase [Bauldia sp.]|nr:ligase-associated DNA damage response DEXH box helicase [Bauldia sp.]
MDIAARPSRPGSAALLPAPFTAWFAARGWQPRPHQVELLKKARAGRSTLLIAPTGAGKTLAGFLPTLTALYEQPPANRPGGRGIHTLYISPLKALAVDIARNLAQPIEEMGLPFRIETRTGDTPVGRRARQKRNPPDILLTTPEQAALLLSASDAPRFFADLDTVILDELHALVTNKRGDLLSLGLARLRSLAPNLKTIGLSATVAEPEALRAWLVAQTPGDAGTPPSPITLSPPAARPAKRPSSHRGAEAMAELVVVKGGAKPDISILETHEYMPWAGHTARYALPEMYEAIRRHKLALLFVNVRSQAELLFQELWRINRDNLPIALHHGSLDATQRRKVEAAMAGGKLRAVVCTSTLDLGIDWGDVDLVMNVGAPKGASRLAQRIGRANHRLDEPSKAYLVPANRFEVLECRAALDANYLGAQDTPPIRAGALDVLAQHVLGMACSAPFDADALYREVTSAYPYRKLDRATFDRVIEFVATGGYALKTYERFAKIRRGADGLWRIANPMVAQQYRLNVGTIIESTLLNVRIARTAAQGLSGRGGRVVGRIEEYFIETLAVGDTFLFAGHVLRFEGVRENEAIATRTADEAPKIPVYAGGKFPLSTYLADGVRRLVAEEKEWSRLPEQVSSWLELQKERSRIPKRQELLIETFPRGNRFFMVAYPFEGRLAHQTLGMLLTRRLERARLRPTGFVASDYALGVWGLRDLGAAFAAKEPSLPALFDEDMLGDDLDAWMADTYLLKRMFRNAALIAGLVEKRHPGKEKSGRQVTISTDLVYDVLRRHEPDHILMRATWADAATGLLDIGRLGDMLKRIKGKIVHQRLDRISPLAVPIMLDIGKEAIVGEAQEDVLREAADDLVREAMGDGGSTAGGGGG